MKLHARVRGLSGAIEALAAVSLEAERAQRSAIRAAGTRAASLTRKAYAARFSGVPQKLWKRRVQAIPKRARRGLADRKLWTGLKNQPTYSEHKGVAKALKAGTPGFEATMRSGHVGWFQRVKPTRPGPRGEPPFNRQAQRARNALPIKEARLDVSDEAKQVMVTRGTEAMRTVYVKQLERELARRVKSKFRRALK